MRQIGKGGAVPVTSVSPAVEAAPDDGEAGRDLAVEALFRSHYRELVRLAFCVLGERGPAEDAVQDAFVALYWGWGRLRERDSAHAYLRATVLNQCRLRIRANVRERSQSLLTLVDPLSEPAEDLAVPRTEAARLGAAVQQLPRRQCEVIVCRYYLDLSIAETAALLDVSTGSVKRHGHRAVQALSRRLEVTP